MFITFEGIDGCGKSTQIRLLAAYLEGKGNDVVTLREPGGTDFSERIRDILLKSHYHYSPTVELLLFEAARAHLVESVVKPALDEGKIVISDRFYDSTTAYQGFGRRLDINNVMVCNEIAANGLEPDATFYLDIPVESAEIRAGKKKKDKIEISGDDFYNRVRNGFNWICQKEPERFFHIDATGTVDETHNLIIQKLNEINSSITKRKIKIYNNLSEG